LNGTHQVLALVDDVNLLGDNMHTIKKNTQALIDVRKEVSLEVNTDVDVSSLECRVKSLYKGS
jgi:hypothetical protein